MLVLLSQIEKSAHLFPGVSFLNVILPRGWSQRILLAATTDAGNESTMERSAVVVADEIFSK
jgi:hypothetical protein